ncbi:hypothetical protein KAW43_01055 [Candidatus Parcubacteria bacterium]|nr:hypothetical protein [Candidatus Parcubacteria bacterium]
MNEDIKKIIKQKGYWRVVIRPTQPFYRVDRFDISELAKIIEDNQVRLRGWYYPHISRNDIKIIEQNAISNECKFEGYIEYWEFITSGQFAHIFSMKEDYIIDKQKADEIKSDFAFNKDKAKDINKFFETVSTVYKFTEIYLFASNLAQLKEYEDVNEFEIIIELNDVKDRLLFTWDRDRDLWSPYICNFDNGKIPFSEIYKKDDLIAKFDFYSLEKVIKTFQFFGWENPNEQVLQGDQKKLLERRL